MDSYGERENPYQSFGMIAADAGVDARADFIRKTYLHLAGAVLAFIGLEAFLVNLPGIEQLAMGMVQSQVTWMISLAAFIGVSWLAQSWAVGAASPGKQYAGLGIYIVAMAIISLPLIFFAAVHGPPNVIPTAALVTLAMFAGLTAIVWFTGADFSFMGAFLGIASLAALGLIVCSMIFGFNLGILFTVGMILLMCGYILYDTSNVIHHYHIGQHVAAALALFASVIMLFWYILQLLMSRR